MTRFTLFILLSLVATKLYSQSALTIRECPDDSIAIWLKTFHVPTVGIGIIENGKIKSVKVYGELKANVKAPVNALWNVASLTKPVTSAIVMKLVDQGQWDLDEPLYKYWIDPDIKDQPYTSKLTTRILLSHRSGFKNWRNSGEPDKKLAFHSEPGTTYGYSGEGYEYVRRAMEAKFGKSIQELAMKEVFAPAHMSDTHYGWSAGIDSSRFAEPHNTEGKIHPFFAKGVSYSAKQKVSNAANWLITSVSDYCRFGIYVMERAGLSEKTYRQWTRIHSPFDTTKASSHGMSLGWIVIRNLPHDEYVLTHNGSNPGVITLVVLFPKSKRGIVIFTNSDGGMMLEKKILKSMKIDLEGELRERMDEFK